LVEWNAEVGGEWIKEIDGSDLVINFAGKSVNCRYTKKNKKAIFDSRVNATKAIGDAINKAIIPPKLWINAASATIYRYATDHAQDELTGEMQDDLVYRFANYGRKRSLINAHPSPVKLLLGWPLL
jgi:NAD dependent epimerase/dehydratase family enzyme